MLFLVVFRGVLPSTVFAPGTFLHAFWCVFRVFLVSAVGTSALRFALRAMRV